jgi:integrase
MDEWGWNHLRPWLTARAELPAGPLFASSTAPPADDRCRAPRSAPSSAAWQRPPAFAPHQLRHAHALELARAGGPLNIIERQLGHYVGDLVKGEGSESASRVAICGARDAVIAVGVPVQVGAG